MGGCIGLASPGHTYAAHAAGITNPRGVVPSSCCIGSACHTSRAASARANCATSSPRAFKAEFTAFSPSAFITDCTDIIIAAIHYAYISITAKDAASRRLGSLFDKLKTLPSQNVLSLLVL
jgi:hypothetical protein